MLRQRFVNTDSVPLLLPLVATILAQIGLSQVVVSAEPTPKAARPNFVIIMADDLGYGDLSCYDGWIPTPNIDRLAKEGMKFLDFHSSGNVCSPTRAGLMTGRYQQRAGIPGVVYADPARDAHYHGLQTSEVTFAKLLKNAGYRTAIFGKWHLGYETKYNPIHHGFDLFRGYVSGNVDYISHVDQAGQFDWWHQDQLVQEPGYSTHLITQHAVKFIEDNQDRPFCLYLPHEAPHYPYQRPNDSAQRSVNQVRRVRRPNDKETYRIMVEEVDKGVGAVLAKLKECGLDNNTLVVFFSDNGATKLGSNGKLRGQKGTDWEGGHRVPMVARFPGMIRPGSESRALTISLDVMPTMLEMAGVSIPANLDGVSLLSHLKEAPTQKRVTRKLFWNGRAMRDGSWKLMVDNKKKKPSKNRGRVKPQLFDLSNDLSESKNVAAKHPQRVTEMLSQLKAWKEEVHRVNPQPVKYATEQSEKAKKQKAKTNK